MRIPLWLTAGMIMLIPAAALAESVALLPPTGTNVNPELLKASGEVLKDHLLRTGRFNVLSLAGEPGETEAPPAQAAELARSVNASMAVLLHITHLGTTAHVRLTAYDAATGAMRHSDYLPAAGPEDLDPVLARLATGLATGKPARQNAEIETVTNKELAALSKRVATKTFGVRVCSLFVLNRAASDGAAPAAGLGVFWLYDARNWLADVALDFGSGNGNHSFSVGVGAYYPLGRGDIAPYLGGSAKWAAVSFGGVAASGIMLEPALGVLLGRLSTTLFRAEVGYFVDTFPEAELTSTFGVNGPSHYSHGPTIRLGIAF